MLGALAMPMTSASTVSVSIGEGLDLAVDAAAPIVAGSLPADSGIKAVDNGIDALDSAPHAEVSGAGAFTLTGLVLNWNWYVTIYIPILEPEVERLPAPSILATMLKANEETECPELAVGDGAHAFGLMAADPRVTIRYIEIAETFACDGIEAYALTFGVEVNQAPVVNKPVTANVPDLGALDLKGSCQEIRHGNGLFGKESYEHVRTGEAILNTFILQAHIESLDLRGRGDGKCTQQHDTSMAGRAVGTFLAALPIAGLMDVETDGVELGVGDWVGGSVDIQAKVSFVGSLQLPTPLVYYSINGFGNFLGA